MTEDYDIPERRVESLRHKMSRDDWYEMSKNERTDWDGHERRGVEPRKTDISEASISLEKVGVILASLLGLIGTAVTGWISLNQHLSDMSARISTSKVSTDSKLDDLTEKSIEQRARIEKLEESFRRRELEQESFKRDTINDIMWLKDKLNRR